MDLDLQGKTVLVAGSSQGIGLGIARGFLGEGANVIMTGRTPEKLENATKGLADKFGDAVLTSYAGDMTDTDQIENAFVTGEEVFGKIDIVIANVGLDNTPLGFDISDEQWESGIRQNLHSAFRMGRAALRRFEVEASGSLIFISSVAGLTEFGTPINYGTSKSAVNHLTREFARHVGAKGIRVNCICPGNIIFPGGEWEHRFRTRPEAWDRWLKREVALQRFGKVDEIADACLWLSSARASFVTGAVIPIDGGHASA